MPITGTTQMSKNKISQYIIFISIFTLVSIFITVAQKSYANLIGPINQVKSSNLIKPINPEIDLDTLKLVESRLEPISP